MPKSKLPTFLEGKWSRIAHVLNEGEKARTSESDLTAPLPRNQVKSDTNMTRPSTSPIVGFAVALALSSHLVHAQDIDPPELGIQTAVELTWPSAADQEYRLYRSLGGLEHFFPLGDPVAGTGGEIRLFDSTKGTQQAFYKLKIIPPPATAAEILAAHDLLVEAVNEKKLEDIPPLFASDVLFDEVPEPPLKNREASISFFADLFEVFPDYTDFGGVSLPGENVLVGDHQAQGTHLGEWDLGPLGIIPPTGAVVSAPHLGVFEYEGDKIFRYTLYYDAMTMLVQIGAFPAPEPIPLEPSIELPEPAPSGLSAMETVAETHTRWEGSDIAAYMAFFAEDADLVMPGFPPGLNRDQLAAIQEGFWLAFPDRTMTTTRTIDLGDGWVSTEALWVGTNTGPYFGTPASGQVVALRGAILSRVNSEGLITYFHVYFDNLTMLAQMGMLGP